MVFRDARAITVLDTNEEVLNCRTASYRNNRMSQADRCSHTAVSEPSTTNSARGLSVHAYTLSARASTDGIECENARAKSPAHTTMSAVRFPQRSGARPGYGTVWQPPLLCHRCIWYTPCCGPSVAGSVQQVTRAAENSSLMLALGNSYVGRRQGRR